MASGVPVSSMSSRADGQGVINIDTIKTALGAANKTALGGAAARAAAAAAGAGAAAAAGGAKAGAGEVVYDVQPPAWQLRMRGRGLPSSTSQLNLSRF